MKSYKLFRGQALLSLLLPALLIFPTISVVGSFLQDIPEERQFSSRKFQLVFDMEDSSAGDRSTELWVTRDRGNTWRAAGEADIEVAWRRRDGGQIACTIQVPEAGSYRFLPLLDGAKGDPVVCEVIESGAGIR